MADPVNFYHDQQRNHLVPNPYSVNEIILADVDPQRAGIMDPNTNLVTTVAELRQRLVLLEQGSHIHTLWGIDIMSHAKFVFSSLYGYLFIKTLLYIWWNFFPYLSLMKVLVYLTFAVTICIALNILLFAKRQYEKRFDPIPRIRILPTLSIILMAFGISSGFQRENIMENVSKIVDNRFWIESLKVAVVELEYAVQAMDEKITKQIDELDEKYKELLAEMQTVENAEEFASKIWESLHSIVVLGYFADRTWIQNEGFGNMIKVETLNCGDTVFNQQLNRTAKVMLCNHGPVDEDVFEFVTVNGYHVTITKSHPMFVCTWDRVWDILDLRCGLVLADEVQVGDSVTTMNGAEQVVEIVRRPGAGIMVNNVLTDFDEDV